MRINQNISALNAYRNMVMTDNRLNKSLERLSSGLRINRAADDAAGLAISEKMRGQIRGLNQAMRNAQDGISYIQTAEGGLNETHAILQRMRELSVQAASDTLTLSDRQEIQKEINQLTAEIDRIANTTEFNTKKLLDGTTSALTSTDRLSTKVFMRDGLRVMDQFGQKEAGGGNYRLEIDATPGQAQIQKTDLMKIKHEGGTAEILTSYAPDAVTEADDGVIGDDFLTGSATGEFALELTFSAATAATGTTDVDTETVTVTGDPGAAYNGLIFSFAVDTSGTGGAVNAAYNAETNTITLTFDQNDEASDAQYDDSDIEAALSALAATNPAGLPEGIDLTQITFSDDANGSTGAQWGAAADLTLSGGTDAEWEVTGDSPAALLGNTYAEDGSIAYLGVTLDLSELSDFDNTETVYVFTTPVQTISFNEIEGGTFTISYDGVTTGPLAFDASTDTVQTALRDTFGDFGDDAGINLVTVTGSPGQWSVNFLGENFRGEEAPELTIDRSELLGLGSIGDLARGDTRIENIDRFWDASGNFLVHEPQTITLVQGNGNMAAFTIFRDDTIEDVVNKLDAAIRNPVTNNPGTIEVGKGLGQGVHDPNGNAEFAYYVTEPTSGGTFDTVQGTIVINSAVTGSAGEIKFVGNDDVINALSLTTIREAKENQFTVNVYNAHSDAVVAENVQISGNRLVGTVHANVDVEFDAMANIAVNWQTEVSGFGKGDYENQPNAFYFESQAETYQTFVHLADNTTVFHIGANPLQDITAAIGDMRSSALGVDNVQVTDRASANKAISQIDSAIGRVSAERSKMGALQNRLEHTINNLGVSAENLTAAESRIRDLDFAMEMIEFTRNQIMMQAGTAMLAQANMKPQSVLMLLG